MVVTEIPGTETASVEMTQCRTDWSPNDGFRTAASKRGTGRRRAVPHGEASEPESASDRQNEPTYGEAYRRSHECIVNVAANANARVNFGQFFDDSDYIEKTAANTAVIFGYLHSHEAVLEKTYNNTGNF
uniref:Uncharacterized protein n=1 Tax=Romanomermis culicivorax TaxID=13658 RepID=A0A915ILK7_ROMCU